MTQSNEWIKVTHKMPPLTIQVIAWNGLSQVITARYKDYWCHDVDWYDYDNVTHWKHSEPPKE